MNVYNRNVSVNVNRSIGKRNRMLEVSRVLKCQQKHKSDSKKCLVVEYVNVSRNAVSKNMLVVGEMLVEIYQ